MGYLVQKTRAAALTIGGQDYTSSFVELQVSDVSAFKNGLITTSGTLILGQRPGQADIQDYNRNIFKRGTLVTLDITEPGGVAYRHPRGHLYVLTVSYDVEAEQLVVEVGCRLALAYLIDDESTVLPLVPVPLDPAQQTIQSCSASFASAGMILYQDNQGNLQSRKFFGTDGTGGIEAGDFVSVLGETALSVAPLSGGNAIPDVIRLSYQTPLNALASDEPVRETTDVVTSKYYIDYPAVAYTRVPESDIGEACLPAKEVVADDCGGNLAPPGNEELGIPGEQEDILCECQWSSERTAVFLPATKVVTTKTNYGGPAGQTSYQLTEERGPLVEANSQFYADLYAYCKRIYGYACKPGGGCRYEGMDNALLSRTTTVYTYNKKDNSLQKTIQETYRIKLSVATPDNWRSGVNNGIPQNFQSNFANKNDNLYLDTAVITEYSKENNLNKQETTTYRSIASVGVNSGVSLNAYKGIKTVETRVSSSNVTNDIKPDATVSPTTQTTEQTTRIPLYTNSYITPPAEAGDYELKESIPVPLLSTNESQVDTWVNDYSDYLTRFIKGDLYGLQIGESMRSEIVDGWYPGRPFRYADTQNNKIVAMRMDACTWGVTPEEAVVVTNGIWNGFSSGTLSVGSNLVGNSTPTFDETPPTAPPAPAPPPVIDNDVVGESFAFEIDIELRLENILSFYGEDGVLPPNPELPEYHDVSLTLIPFVGGIIVAAGDTLGTTGTGSIPLDNDGLLVTANATVIDGDVFSA